MLIRTSLRWNLTWEVKFCFLIPKTRFCGSYFVEVRTKFYQVYLLLMCIPHFNLLKHFTQHDSLQPFPTSSRKTQEQKFIFQICTSAESMSAFHSTNLFLFSLHHIPTNSVARFSAYNTHSTHDSSNRYNEGLALESATFKLFTVANLRSFIINSVDNTKLFCYYSPTNVAPQFL